MQILFSGLRCNFTLAVRSDLVQNFSSPGFPNSYINHLNCTWNLIAEENTEIGLRFHPFALEDGYDMLTVKLTAVLSFPHVNM